MSKTAMDRGWRQSQVHVGSVVMKIHYSFHILELLWYPVIVAMVIANSMSKLHI